MKFEKSPPWLLELFGEALAGTPGERRQMFGYPCGFLNGQLFCGLFASSMFVRLGEAERSELLAIEGGRPFDPMGGRPMREYVVLPPALLEDAGELGRWLSRAATYASSLPPKKTPANERGLAKKRPPAKKRGRG